MGNSIKLHRILHASPEKVYRAVLDPDALVKWSPPNGFTARVHHLDAKVGDTYKMSFTNFSTAKATPSADSIWNSLPTNESGSRTSSTIRTCRGIVNGGRVYRFQFLKTADTIPLSLPYLDGRHPPDTEQQSSKFFPRGA